MAIAAITATAVCLGACWDAANAQNSSTNQPTAAQLAQLFTDTAPPTSAPHPNARTQLAQSITATANPSGVFPVAAPPAASAAPALALPSGVSEVLKLFKGGISADIMISYINSSPLSFYLSADNLIALQQQGLPAPVLTAMMERYGELQRQTVMAAAAPAQYQPQAAAPQYATQPQYATAVQVPAQAPAPEYYSYAPAQPAVVYPYVAPPVYPAYDPYYYDPSYYPWYPIGGPVVFDFGIGHFGGGFGGRFGGGGHFGGGGRR